MTVPMFAPEYFDTHRAFDVSDTTPDREIARMPSSRTFPAEAFDKKMSPRELQNTVKAVERYAHTVARENRHAADGGFYFLLAHIAGKLNRVDLVNEFERRAEECAIEAVRVQPIRRVPKAGHRRGRTRQPQPDQATRIHRPADLPRDE